MNAEISVLKKDLKTEIVEEVAAIVNNAFGELEIKMKEELDKKPSKEDLFGWDDKRIEPIELDVDRLKYFHKDEWKKLPNQPEITAGLVKASVK